MNRRLPSLNALRCFEVVAAHLSIRKAATALHVSESAVSRQVRILEEQLGAQLFARSHNGLEITPTGARLAADVSRAFGMLAEAVAPFQEGQDAILIRVLPTFALRWLLPRLDRFRDRHPLIKVVVQTRLNDMTPADTDADIGIRYGIGAWPADCAQALYEEWILPVCAPGYLAGSDDLERELELATLLHPLPDRRDWLTWTTGAGRSLNVARGLDFDALDMALSAAEAGFGVAMTDVVLAHEAIQAERLVVPVRQPVATGVSYFLVRPAHVRHRREIRLFEKWLLGEISEAPAIVSRYGRESHSVDGSVSAKAANPSRSGMP